ncbi:MAG: hypothetical protein ACTSYC_03245 [Promethearchaeota archaeon]
MVNEFSILMYLLTRKNGNHGYGTTKKEIIEKLNIKNKNKDYLFTRLLENLANYIVPLGLKIRYNPIDSHWFIAHDEDLTRLTRSNPFEDHPKLAATLLCSLTSCLKNTGSAKIIEIKNLRKKKDIMPDLKELEKMGYLIIDEIQSEIKLTPLIGYQLDLSKLLLKITLKTNEKKVE